MAQDQQTDSIERQAAQWVLRRRGGPWNENDQAELEAWLALGPDQRSYYRRADQVWDRFDRLQGANFPALTAARGYRKRRARRRLLWTGVGGFAAAALLLALRWPLLSGAASYRTGIGERSAITLADGTNVDLNTDSELQVRYTGDRRRLELLKGEAYFVVASDPARPFIVHAGALEIEDIGTRFDVHLGTGGTVVAVAEGSVAVHGASRSTTRISAGRRGIFAADGALRTAGSVDASVATAWREGRLVFERRPLTEVLEEVARYHPVHWEYADPALGQLTLTGSFNTGNLSDFLAALQAVLPITAQPLDNGRIRLSRATRRQRP